MRRLAALLVVTLAVIGCHDVNSIARFDAAGFDAAGLDAAGFDAGEVPDTGPRLDVGPGMDAALDGGPLPDAFVPDAGPPPESLGATFENTFLVRGAARLGGGILVVGVDNQGDRDTEDTRQALALFLHEADPTQDWAAHYGGPEDNDQFLAVAQTSASRAVVAGVQGIAGTASVAISEFSEAGLTRTSTFVAAGGDAYIADILVTDDEILVSGRSGEDAAVFIIDLELSTMQTLRYPIGGNFAGVAAEGRMIYAAGAIGSDAVLAVIPREDLPSSELFTLADAEFLSVAATGRGAVAVGVEGGRGLRVAFGSGGVTEVDKAPGLSRFREVAIVEGAERYAGLGTGANSPFVAERAGDDIAIGRVPATELTGNAGRAANLRDGGFLAVQAAIGNRVQLVRFNTLATFGRATCARTDPSAVFVDDPGLMARFVSATQAPSVTIDVSPMFPTLLQTPELMEREASCP